MLQSPCKPMLVLWAKELLGAEVLTPGFTLYLHTCYPVCMPHSACATSIHNRHAAGSAGSIGPGGMAVRRACIKRCSSATQILRPSALCVAAVSQASALCCRHGRQLRTPP